MALLEWRDSFRTGIGGLDHEHESLIRDINLLHEGLVDGGGAADGGDFFGGLYAMISAHFALEERLMRTHRYDHYSGHKEDHERLLDELREIMELYDRGGDAAYDEALARRLGDWFSNHFATQDARLHDRLGPA